MSLPTTQEQRSLVELARDKGYDVLTFLEKVMGNEWTGLGEQKSIPLSLRLAAADLLRKFASLPSNVNLELDVKKVIEYTGDRDVKPLPPGRLPEMPEASELRVRNEKAAPDAPLTNNHTYALDVYDPPED